MNSVTQGLLRAGHTVKVLCVESDKHPLRLAPTDQPYVDQTGIEAVHIDLAVKPLPAAVAMLCGESYNVQRYRSTAFAQRLKDLLCANHYDIIHVESIFLTPYVSVIRKYSTAPIVLRAHNVEHLIWRQMAACAHMGFKRSYLNHLALTLRAYEQEHVNDYDGVMCITDIDADAFRQMGCRRPIVAIPFGIEPEQSPSVEAEPYSLFHIGSMDWRPNRQGVEWLMNKVWPEIHRVVPQAKLYLAGRKMPAKWMESKHDGIVMVGEVPDAVYFINSKQINLVPLLSGSGIRVKIIEAMAAGKVVITTSVGAAGIIAENGTHLLIADTANEFAQQVKHCFDHPEKMEEMSRMAQQLVAEQYNTTTLTQQMITFYNKTMQSHE